MSMDAGEVNPVGLRLGLLLRQAHRRAATALDESLTPLGLSGRHFGVLLLLHREGVSTQRDLIRQTGSDKAGMVRTVEHLEGLGYLTRTQSDTDRRVAELSLTESGTTAFATARRLAEAVATRLCADLTATEVETLEGLLSRFAADPDRNQTAAADVASPSGRSATQA